MKTMLQLLILLLASALVGCAGTRDPYGHDRADLVEIEAGKTLLAINHREWGGLLGPHGYIGYRSNGYLTALEGSGPVFINPHFLDNPPFIPCIGTITLDREHNKVTVNMRRIVSKPEEPVRTKPHPANGTFTIESVKTAGIDD